MEVTVLRSRKASKWCIQASRNNWKGIAASINKKLLKRYYEREPSQKKSTMYYVKEDQREGKVEFVQNTTYWNPSKIYPPFYIPRTKEFLNRGGATRVKNLEK
ncbi:8323_t:CDS:2 [Gigaspora rosea]|nr:8323_t:CDS:2 [Gigaspora rosea]